MKIYQEKNKLIRFDSRFDVVATLAIAAAGQARCAHFPPTYLSKMQDSQDRSQIE